LQKATDKYKINEQAASNGKRLYPYFIHQGSKVTLAGSKINSSKFYYLEKSENLHSCSLIC
jgi:hypothetical protein